MLYRAPRGHILALPFRSREDEDDYRNRENKYHYEANTCIHIHRQGHSENHQQATFWEPITFRTKGIKACEKDNITYCHLSSSSSCAGFREATGIRRATTSKRRHRALCVEQTLAWSRLGRKRSFASLIGRGQREECENTVNHNDI